jgi:hypothetical protein
MARSVPGVRSGCNPKPPRNGSQFVRSIVVRFLRGVRQLGRRQPWHAVELSGGRRAVFSSKRGGRAEF